MPYHNAIHEWNLQLKYSEGIVLLVVKNHLYQIPNQSQNHICTRISGCYAPNSSSSGGGLVGALRLGWGLCPRTNSPPEYLGFQKKKFVCPPCIECVCPPCLQFVCPLCTQCVCPPAYSVFVRSLNIVFVPPAYSMFVPPLWSL